MRGRSAKAKKNRTLKRIRIITLLLILIVVSWLTYSYHSRIEFMPPLEKGLTVVKGKLIDLRDLDPETKRIMIYNGALDVPPPCPPDTHLEGEYCRKGSSKDDLNIKFVGSRQILLDDDCLPDRCMEQCRSACRASVGEDCLSSTKYGQANEPYRCLFTVSQGTEPSYPNEQTDKPITLDDCKRDFETYQSCMNKLSVDPADLKSILTFYDEQEKCQKAYDITYANSGCGTVYNRYDPRFTDAADPVFCYVNCL